MTEHNSKISSLKEIWDLIWYDFEENWFYYSDLEYSKNFYKELYNEKFMVDVREIIFTPDFRNKCIEWIRKIRHKEDFELMSQSEEDFDRVMEHLDNPVQYLYNLSWLWKKN